MGERDHVTRRYSIGAVERTFQVIEALSRQKNGLRLTELTDQLRLAKSTAFGILVTMERLGYVEYDLETDRYKLGLRLYAVASRLAEQMDLVQIATPILQGLVDRLGDTANLGVLKDGKVYYLASIEGAGPLKVALPPGYQADVHCTALGKVLLASQPAEKVRETLAALDLRAYTERTCTDPAALAAELARVREQGYAVDDEEEVQGVRCLAAPVRDQRGRAVAAISITGPVHRIPQQRWEELARVLKEAAGTISARLGHLNEGASGG